MCADELAGLYKAVSEPLRLGILRILRQDSFAVLELGHMFAVPQSGMSHHLKVLLRVGLVATRKEGNTIFYQRPVLATDSAKTAIYAAVDRLPVPEVVNERRQQVQQQRGLASRAFFERYAEKFAQRQACVAEHGVYADAVLQLLRANTTLRCDHVVEVGTGTGVFLGPLAEHFGRVTALDISAAMLDQARQRAVSQGLTGVEFVQGSLEDLVSRGVRADCVVMNMVLHHVPSPAHFLALAARVISDDGVVLVSELGEHAQDWVRESCGDLWLGFGAEVLVQWARQAGLRAGRSLYSGLRNGFHVQVHSFYSAGAL